MDPDCNPPSGNFPAYLEDPTSVEGYTRTRSEARERKAPLSRFYSRVTSNRSNTTSNQSSSTGNQPTVTWCPTCRYCHYCDPSPPDLRQHYRRCPHGNYMQPEIYGQNLHFCPQGRDEQRRQQQEAQSARLHQTAYQSAGYAGGTQYTYQALSHTPQPHNQPQSHHSQASSPHQYYQPPSSQPQVYSQPTGHHPTPTWSQQPASSHDYHATTPSMGISQASTWNSSSSGYNNSPDPPPAPRSLPRAATWHPGTCPRCEHPLAS